MPERSAATLLLFAAIVIRQAPVPTLLGLSISKHMLLVLENKWVHMAVGKSVLLWKQRFRPFLESLVIYN